MFFKYIFIVTLNGNNVTVKMTYHNVLIGFTEELYKNHAAINTIIMAVKKGCATKKDWNAII